MRSLNPSFVSRLSRICLFFVSRLRRVCLSLVSLPFLLFEFQRTSRKVRKLSVVALALVFALISDSVLAAWTDTKNTGDAILASDWNAMVTATWDSSNGNVYRSTGKVGIGTTAPNRSLQIHDSVGVGYFQMTSSTSGTTATDGLEFNIGTDASIWNYETGYLRFGTADAEAIRILSGGNVGIGESSPSSLLEMSSASPYLTIHNTAHEDTDYGREGEIIFKGEQSGGEETTLGKIQVAHDGVADDQKGIMSFKVNDGTDGDAPTTAMTILADGNVYVKSNSPKLILEAVAINNRRIEFTPGLGGLDSFNTYFQLNRHSNMHVVVGQDSAANLAVGAGAASGARFSVKSSGSTIGNAVSIENSGGTSLFHIKDSGNVGIGTTDPKNKLDIEGGLAVGAGYSGTNTAPSNGAIIEGNVGIGTDSPTDTLDVNGTFRIHVDADTIADNAVGSSPATHTLQPSTSYVELTCSDADGCTITMSETAANQGQEVTIVNVSANVCNFADTATVSELAGAFTMGQYDVLKLIYTSDRWVEVSGSDN